MVIKETKYWEKYRKAKEIENKMDIVRNIANDSYHCKFEDDMFPAYTFLKGREDFKEYLKKVRQELQKEFDEI